MNIKKNLPLIVALAIPLVLTAVVAASVYLPMSKQDPQYDFLYTVTDYNRPGGMFFNVYNGKLEAVSSDQNGVVPDKGFSRAWATEELYYYDVKTNTSKKLSFNDAAEFVVDDSNLSPDGFRVEYGSNRSMFPFFDGPYENGLYIIGNGRRVKTTITGYNSNFLAWVIKK